MGSGVQMKAQIILVQMLGVMNARPELMKPVNGMMKQKHLQVLSFYAVLATIMQGNLIIARIKNSGKYLSIIFKHYQLFYAWKTAH